MWSYDKTYQLTNECRAGGSAYNTTYIYDSAGNRLVKVADTARTTTVYDVAIKSNTARTSPAGTSAPCGNASAIPPTSLANSGTPAAMASSTT